MFVFANLFFAIAELLNMAITIYIWIVIIRAVLSWFSPDPYNPIVRFLIRITEPLLGRIRSFLPDLGGLDVSPIILIFALYLAKIFLVSTFRDLAFALR